MKRLRFAVVAIAAMAVIPSSSLVSADLECAIGWGKGTHVISKDLMDDGYCDCPLDGADETNTNACSGSMVGAFTGIPAVSIKSQTYQCPQQKKLQIPYSRFNDGICDCCDGSDELPSVCPDICDQVLAEERALREKMAREFTVGREMRQKQIADFQIAVKDSESKKAVVEEELESVQEKLSEVESQIDQVKHEYMQQRITRAGEIATRVATVGDAATNDSSSSLTGLLEPLTNDEIADFIVHSCQMAGEMKRADDLDGNTCVPLRLAGLDTGLIWSVEKGGKADFDRLHVNVREEGKTLADKLVANAEKDDDEDKEIFQGGRKQVKSNRKKNRHRNKKGRRRLQEVSSDDDYLEEYDEEDEYDPEAGDENDNDNDSANDDNSQEQSLEAEIFEKLRETLFSQPRVAFLQRSQEIMDGIEALTKTDDSDDEGDDAKEEDTKTEKSAEEDTVDTAAYDTVKSSLKDREDSIEQGYDYAVSARILLNALVESTTDHDQLRKDFFSLAVGTLVYGELSATHIWQISQSILPEFFQNIEDQANKEKTCASSPWVVSCPPRSITRQTMSFPPQVVLQAAQVLCTTPTFTQEKAQACAADADNELPTVMPDGYYGYEVIQEREESDPLNTFAAEWDAPMEESVLAELTKLNDQIEVLEKEKKTVEDSIREIDELVTGAKESRYGREGELYALKDDCFSVKAGKYTYEGCPFGKAAQKEGDKNGGTGLGDWEGADYEAETGKRILKWTNGVKCWNGPKRSATAYVTCGAETKVLLADEPDTCRYVLHMESHIACDDAFKKLHDL